MQNNRNVRTRTECRSWCWQLACLAMLLAGATASTAAAQQDGKWHVLLVGVNDYGAQMKSLRFAENDVVQFAKLVQNLGGHPDDVVVMTQRIQVDKRDPHLFPSARNIIRQLDLLLERIDKNDMVVVGLTGHGINLLEKVVIDEKEQERSVSYFIPADGDIADPMSLLKISDVYARLEKCPAQFRLLLTDACRNEAKNDDEPDSPDVRGVRRAEGDRVIKLFSNAAPPRGVAALYSCMEKQFSIEDADLKHGVFFYYLMEGMKGAADTNKDGMILPEELSAYVKAEVARHAARKFQIAQTPDVRMQIEGLFAFRPPLIKRVKPGALTSPFNTTSAKESQNLWADYLGIEARMTSRMGLELVLIPPGEFMMGSPDTENGRDDDETRHRVTLTEPYFLGANEVTKGQFAAFVNDAGYKTEAERDGKGGYGYVKNAEGTYEWKQEPRFTWRNPGFTQGNNEPVVNVSWNDAVAYCNWLSRKEGLPEYYRIEGGVTIRGEGPGYRLPTEAEWEYACRAGTTSRYSFGDNQEDLARHGNVADASGRVRFNWNTETTIRADDGYSTTAPVGSFQPNGFGLYDMHGNVWEWCWDWYGAYGDRSVRNPAGPNTGWDRVIRGGSWGSVPQYARSALRNGGAPAYRDYDLGFRVASSPLVE